VRPDIPIAPAIELSGVFIGALSGGLAAVRLELDLVGVLVLAWAAGLGGGLLRDVLIGAIPPVGISDWRFIAVACLAGVVMYVFHPRLEHARRPIAVLDAGALALYTVSGTLKALDLGFGGVTAISAGILTGIGGGVLRDLLSDEVPAVLHQRQLYAVPSALGATLTAVLWAVGALTSVTVLVAAAVVFGLRVGALRYRLQVPGPRPAPPRGSRRMRGSRRLRGATLSSRCSPPPARSTPRAARASSAAPRHQDASATEADRSTGGTPPRWRPTARGGRRAAP